MMKISDHEVIQAGEQELIDAITADLDWGAIEKVFKEKHNLGIEEDVEYKKGDIVVHNNQVAYKLEFNVNVVLSVLLDREGKYISAVTPGDLESGLSDNKDSQSDASQTDVGEPENHNGAISPDLTSLVSTEPEIEEAAAETDLEEVEEAGVDDDLEEAGDEEAPGAVEEVEAEADTQEIEEAASSREENPQEQISQMTSLAEEMISEMENEDQEIGDKE